MTIRTKLFFCLFLLVLITLYGSSDSLQIQLKNQPNDERLQTYESVISELFALNETDSALLIIDRAMEDGADIFPKEKVKLLFWKGRISEKNFAYEQALRFFTEALQIAEKSQDASQVIDLQLHIGTIHKESGNNRKALLFFKNALNNSEKAKDKIRIGQANEKLGLHFLNEKNYENAQVHLGKSVEIYADNNHLEEAADNAFLLGSRLDTDQQYDLSITWLRMSLDLHRVLNQQAAIGKDFMLIAEVLTKKGDFPEAIINNQQALQIFIKTQNTEQEAAALLNLSEIFFKTKKEQQGKNKIEEAVKKIDAVSLKERQISLFEKVADIYVSIDDFENAWLIQNRILKIKDIIAENEKSLTTAELSAKYESRLSAEARQQKLDLIESEKSVSEKNKLLWLALALLAIMMAASLFHLNKSRVADNLELQKNNEKIEKQHLELQSKNTSLELLNQRLLEEISEREHLERSSFERDRFLATMTHRMGTPLNSIVGLTHLLMGNTPRDDQRQHLRTLQFSANSLVVFINDVLDFSKIEAGKLKPEATEFRPRRLFNDMREQAEMEAVDKELNLNFSYNNKIPKLVSGDPARLNQILTNLINTSLKSTSDGEIAVKFDVAEGTDDHVMFYTEISDTGQPLEPDIVARIFGAPDEYYLLGKQNGIAFAMTMARRLIELQGGKFELFVNEKHGNLFRFWLPYKKVESELPFAEIQTKTLPERLKGNKILLVEDNQINQMVVARMLQNLGIQVVTANNGLEALDRVKEYNFDLILMDIQMPLMDGYRATKSIRKIADPVKSTVPIIALTASAFLTHEDKARLFGMNDHVGKPFSPDELLDKIDKLLRKVKKKN